MGHSFDLFFLFDDFTNPGLVPDGLDLQSATSLEVKDVFRGALTQFAKSGNPSLGLSNTSNFWPRFDLSDRCYVAMTSPPEVRRRVLSQRMSLWQDFLPQVVYDRHSG